MIKMTTNTVMMMTSPRTTTTTSMTTTKTYWKDLFMFNFSCWTLLFSRTHPLYFSISVYVRNHEHKWNEYWTSTFSFLFYWIGSHSFVKAWNKRSLIQLKAWTSFINKIYCLLIVLFWEIIKLWQLNESIRNFSQKSLVHSIVRGILDLQYCAIFRYSLSKARRVSQ